jgi:DNA polymerase III sliding clamp (beta) subunit (PCNA family)
MIIKTKDFQEAANKILLAAELDTNAANLELVTKGDYLYLNVTNKEYYVSVKFAIDSAEEFRAVVDASLFLTLISGINTAEFELNLEGNIVKVKAGKSNYKVALIYDNDKLMELPVIYLAEPTVEMKISNEILMSILNVNSKEIQKVKALAATQKLSELNKLYYVDETGCFTFTTGSCLNSFTLEKPIKMLLNEKIVKLFRLFKEDVDFAFGYDADATGTARPKAIFKTGNVYMAAKLTCDDVLLQKVKGPCDATKNYINETYPTHIVLSAQNFAAAISRLMLFTKNSIDKANMNYVVADISFTNDEVIITDTQGNVDVVAIENDGSYVDTSYSFRLNIADLKLVLDSCKNSHVTMNCGNNRAIVLSRGPISNVIPEVRRPI